jgi:hypothetical protein
MQEALGNAWRRRLLFAEGHQVPSSDRWRPDEDNRSADRHDEPLAADGELEETGSRVRRIRIEHAPHRGGILRGLADHEQEPAAPRAQQLRTVDVGPHALQDRFHLVVG